MVIDFAVLAQDPPGHAGAAIPADQTDSYEQQYDRARAFAAAGQHDLAVAAFTTLLARSPGNADVLLGRGLAYARMDRYQEAEADLKAAAAATPTYADVWSALAQVYTWSGRPLDAAAAYDRLIELQPDQPAHRQARERALAASRPPASAEPIDASPSVRPVNPDIAAPGGFDWAANFSGSATRLSLRDQRWNEQSLSVRRYFQRGSLALESLRAHRFGQHAYAWALDGYASLWTGAYANLRYQKAPSERLFPRYSWRAELFQAVGKGWELSASDDRLVFGGSRVDIYGVGIARYVGDFYVRWRHTNIVTEDSRSSGDRLVVRYYHAGNGDDYVEGAVSRGRSEDPLSLTGGRVQSGGGAINLVRFITPRWGVRVGAGYARDSVSGSERTLSAGLSMRW